MSLYILRIEIDGHFHGSSDVPRPWVARIGGTCTKYGLRREFLDQMRDYRDQHRAWSGNRYGVVAAFALREGLYEVSRLRGNSSKRHVARELIWCDGHRTRRLTPEEVLAIVAGDRDGQAVILRVDDDHDDRPWVAEIHGLGMPVQLGWVVVGGERWYRLREGRVYEAREMLRGPRGRADAERRRLVVVRCARVEQLSHEQALALLRGAA